MQDRLILPKFTLIITTRCNLKCDRCCEYVPENTPFSDMTLSEEKAILDAAFDTLDGVDTLHLSGGGEPFLHPHLAEMVDLAFEYQSQFDRFILFTNGTLPVTAALLETLRRNRKKLVIYLSDYGVTAERTKSICDVLRENHVNLRVMEYHGTEQEFGGWVDFGEFEPRGRTPEELSQIFRSCAVTRDMHGNWRTRDGKVHWCSRSQRGVELGLLPDSPDDYVDLLNPATTREEKRAHFRRIETARYLSACDWCSGDQGTAESGKRLPGGVQVRRKP